MFWGHHMGYGGYGLLLTVALWIGLIALGIWLLAKLFPAVGRSADGGNRARRATPTEAAGGETAMEILKKRYARGEIDKEEYETMRQDLFSS